MGAIRGKFQPLVLHDVGQLGVKDGSGYHLECGQLPGLWVVVDVLLNLGIWSLVELIIFALGGDESGI